MTMYSRVLESVLLPAYDQARGREYVRRSKLLRDSQWWSPERVRQFQWNDLKRLMAHVFNSVPYLQQKYRSLGIELGDLKTWEDFRRLPTLTREEVNEHRTELCSTTYTGKLLPHATGGSSGTPTRFFRTYESYDWRTAAKDRAYAWSGWRLGERSAYLWGAPVGAHSRRELWKTRVFERVHRQLIFNTFSQTDALWRDIYARILKFGPVLVVGYVSSLEHFAAFLKKGQLTVPKLRCVIAAAEPLFPATRAAIESAFHAPVYNTYGSREFMSIAGECECRDGLHIHAENLVVEMRDPDADTPSEILVTDLHNYGMPFVRYETGDLGTMTDTPCCCGRGLPRLKTIEGRVLDAMRTADGRTVPGEFFPILLLEIPEVAEFRVHQERIDRIVISAVLKGPVSESSATLLRREIQKAFGSTTVCTLRGVSHIPTLSSGKRRITVGLGG